MFNLISGKFRILTVAAVISLVSILSGCSSPPDDIIEKAIINNHPSLQGGNWYTLDRYEINNSYTREIAGETVYVYDYTMHAKSVKEMPADGAFKNNVSASGTVNIVKRGDVWYGL